MVRSLFRKEEFYLSNIVINHQTNYITDGLPQYGTNKSVNIIGLTVSTAPLVKFYHINDVSVVTDVQSTIVNGEIHIDLPNELLETAIPLHGDVIDGGNIIFGFTIPINPRGQIIQPPITPPVTPPPPQPTYKVMTVKIDLNNPDPETALTYHDDAINMVAGSDAWDDFFGHYPVMLLDGVEGKKLDKNNRTLYEDGTPADITSGAEGDVVVCFPRLGLKIENDGNIVTVSMTDDEDAESKGYKYLAHTDIKGQVKDKLYIGAYKSHIINDKAMSLSGKALSNRTPDVHRTNAQNKGEGYGQRNFYVNTYLQAMYILYYKCLNSQDCLGVGYGQENTARKNTGGVETQPLNYGTQNHTDHVVLFGLEDLWGNDYEIIDGIKFLGEKCYIGMSDYNDENAQGTYKDMGNITGLILDPNKTICSPLNKVLGTTDTGFLPSVINANDTKPETYKTFFSDGIYIKNQNTGTNMIDNSYRYVLSYGNFGHSFTVNGAKHQQQCGLFGLYLVNASASFTSRIIYV